MKTLETIKAELKNEFNSLLNSYVNPSKVAKLLRTDIDTANLHGKIEGLQTALLALGVTESEINNMIDAAHTAKNQK